uniref:Uncharacterized protein n=1 Tax=Panagrolaimus sp. ES5 TaxID=591445 RepID=A0AC34GV84_9BILA
MMIFSGIAIPILIFLCQKKKVKKSSRRPSTRSKKEKKKESRVCNQKSGLLNDDPDLKSNINKIPGTPTSSTPPPQPNEADEIQSTDLASNIFPGGVKPANPPAPPQPVDPGAKTGIPAETKREGSKTMIQGQFIQNKSQFVANAAAGGGGDGGAAAASVANQQLDGTQNPGTTNIDMHTADLTPAA